MVTGLSMVACPGRAQGTREVSGSHGPALTDVVRRRGSFSLTCTDWSTPPGLTVVVGLNGAGKSTLLRLLAGTDTPDVGVASDTRSTVMLPQGARLDTGARVGAVLTYIAALRGIPRRERSQAVERALVMTDLVGKRAEPLQKLSGGWHQRVLIAQCLLGHAGPLLLDEPTASLDVGAARSVWIMMGSVAATVPVVVATHEASAAVEFADHVVVINDGVVGAVWPGQSLRAALRQHGGSPETFLLGLIGGEESSA
jgi:ABC-2 type transport system ATP-binding protein